MNINKAQLIIFGAIGLIVVVTLLLITGILPGLKPRQPSPFTLVVWGFADPPEIWQTIANSYRENAVKSATITYVKKNPETYEGELVNVLASGQGPDIFLLKDSWLEKHKDKIALLPDGTLGYQKQDLKTIFADGLAEAMVNEKNELLGMPLAFDTLALFYNRDSLNSANIPSPPQTWDDVVDQAKRLTKLSEIGGIQRSGIALGTAANVEHASEILLALIYQSGGSILDAANQKSAIKSPVTESALAFYTAFADSTKKTYSWNSFFDTSLAAFAKGDTAMAFGYSRDVLKIISLNPQINFDVALLPQPKNSDRRVTFGRFDLLTVSRISKETEQAWRFLLWLEDKNTEKTYIDAAGLPPARRDLVTSKPPRDYLLPFYNQVLPARTIPIRGGDSLPQIINDMIDAVVNHKFSIQQAIDRAGARLDELLNPRQ